MQWNEVPLSKSENSQKEGYRQKLFLKRIIPQLINAHLQKEIYTKVMLIQMDTQQRARAATL